MPDMLAIRPADLLIDEVNPRLALPNVGQREAQRALARDQERKVQVLAKDIVERGLNPLEPPVVMKHEGDRYMVLEGNRRLGALKALENPDSIAEAVQPGVLKEIRKLSKLYHEAPVDFVQCIVVQNRDEISHWLQLKHTGENEGAGIVRWGPDESARFKARTGTTEPHSQALDFLTKRGDLTPESRQKIKTTNFQRLLEQPEVRDRLGIELRSKRLFFRADENRVAKALMYVIDHLPIVSKIHNRDQRIRYAASLPSSIAVKPTIASGQGTSLADATTSAMSQKGKKKVVVRSPRRREKLIPNDCVLNVSDPRVQAIETELRKLEVDTFANAVSVLLRVFIELSADCYLARIPLAISAQDPLGKKLQAVAYDLVTRTKLSAQQAKPVNKAVSSDSFLAPSVRLMHEYVHNAHLFPAPVDLLAHWNSLQPFIIAMWIP